MNRNKISWPKRLSFSPIRAPFRTNYFPLLSISTTPDINRSPAQSPVLKKKRNVSWECSTGNARRREGGSVFLYSLELIYRPTLPHIPLLLHSCVVRSRFSFLFPPSDENGRNEDRIKSRGKKRVAKPSFFCSSASAAASAVRLQISFRPSSPLLAPPRLAPLANYGHGIQPPSPSSWTT